MDIPCPACGFLVFEGQYGSYVVCPICGWEDDGVQLANPCSGGGANKESLYERQRANLAHLPLTVSEAEGYERDPRWRPLTEEEFGMYRGLKGQKHWHGKAILNPDEAYWGGA